MLDLFADFNGLPDAEAATEFYAHDQYWSNRMISGDSLSVMASLGEREGLRGQVQCIYFDPPYGIKFNSNFQWSTTSRDVKDGAKDHITREPEQVRAFRDTWKDGIHSYLTYLRDRLTVARDLLSESGSIFVQIGDENVHRVRALMDEVFGDVNCVSEIITQKTGGFNAGAIPNTNDFILWYARNRLSLKYRGSFEIVRRGATEGNYQWVIDPYCSMRGLSAEEKRGEVSISPDLRLYQPTSLTSQGASSEASAVVHQGRAFTIPANQHWKTRADSIARLGRSSRAHVAANSLRYVRFADDFPVQPRTNIWTDTATGNFTHEKVYVVQTSTKSVERCILMTTDPGDLVLDPTCGSGTTAYVAEQWGRRWITIDTSRVAIALARSRLMGARYPYYLLADSPEGQAKEGELTRTPPKTTPRITVKPISAVGYDLYTEKFGQPNLAPPPLIRSLLQDAAGLVDGHGFALQFLQNEWADVVDAWHLKTWEEYRDVSRLGRRTRIGGKQREVLWQIFSHVRQRLNERNVVTWSDVFGRMADVLASADRKPFEFAVVDEAQDLSVSESRFLAAMAGANTNGLFFAGDLGQRIFQQPFSWRALGLDVRGRSFTLRINYRTSHQIRAQADRRLPTSVSDMDGLSESRRGTVYIFDGPAPSTLVFDSEEDEIAAVADWISDQIKHAVEPGEIGLFVRSDAQLRRARLAVKAARHQAVELSDKAEIDADRIAIATMHYAKGLEFKCVIVMACDDEVVPLQSRIETVTDEADLKEVYETERHLLYVASTRARDRLLVTAIDPASEFLDDFIV